MALKNVRTEVCSERLLVLDRFHSFFEDLRQAAGGRNSPIPCTA